MRAFFRRQLAFYARYHQHPRNCATHYLGIPTLFVASILPLQACRITFGSFQIPLTLLLVAPVVAGWLLLDRAIGAVLLVAVCLLITIAELIVDCGGTNVTWATAISLLVAGWCLQLLGHSVFERRRPAFVDDLKQTLIGPMFVAARLLVSLGFRRDLAGIVGGEQRVP